MSELKDIIERKKSIHKKTSCYKESLSRVSSIIEEIEHGVPLADKKAELVSALHGVFSVQFPFHCLTFVFIFDQLQNLKAIHEDQMSLTVTTNSSSCQASLAWWSNVLVRQSFRSMLFSQVEISELKKKVGGMERDIGWLRDNFTTLVDAASTRKSIQKNVSQKNEASPVSQPVDGEVFDVTHMHMWSMLNGDKDYAHIPINAPEVCGGIAYDILDQVVCMMMQDAIFHTGQWHFFHTTCVLEGDLTCSEQLKGQVDKWADMIQNSFTKRMEFKKQYAFKASDKSTKATTKPKSKPTKEKSSGSKKEVNEVTEVEVEETEEEVISFPCNIILRVQHKGGDFSTVVLTHNAKNREVSISWFESDVAVEMHKFVEQVGKSLFLLKKKYDYPTNPFKIGKCDKFQLWLENNSKIEEESFDLLKKPIRDFSYYSYLFDCVLKDVKSSDWSGVALKTTMKFLLAVSSCFPFLTDTNPAEFEEITLKIVMYCSVSHLHELYHRQGVAAVPVAWKEGAFEPRLNCKYSSEKTGELLDSYKKQVDDMYFSYREVASMKSEKIGKLYLLNVFSPFRSFFHCFLAAKWGYVTRKTKPLVSLNFTMKMPILKIFRRLSGVVGDQVAMLLLLRDVSLSMIRNLEGREEAHEMMEVKQKRKKQRLVGWMVRVQVARKMRWKVQMSILDLVRRVQPKHLKRHELYPNVEIVFLVFS